MLVRLCTLVLTLAMMVASTLAMAQQKDPVGDALSGALNALTGKDQQKVEGEATEAVPTNRAEIQLTFAPIVRDVAKSVVNVYAVRRQQEIRSPFEGDPFFERFFGRDGLGLPRQKNNTSLGSGVIVSADGIILTNNHVIENMDAVKVSLSDGREFECEIVLKDPKSDLAVLRAKGGGTFAPIEIADSDAVGVGDLVLAIGNPFGVGQTVTMGIVSAVSRSLAGVNDYGYFIQTDAAINPGNSGGALVDMQGRLIGINTAIYSRTGSSVGLGYAIPANMTKVILRSASVGSEVVRPWIGGDFQSITAEIAESLGLDLPRGAIVAGIVKDGPAEKAGLKVGDVVTAVNGLSVENADTLGYRLDTVGVGGTAKLTLLRRGETIELAIDLEAAPETVPADERDMPADTPLFGARIANLSPKIAVQIGLPSDRQGVVVLAVGRTSPAAQNGIRPGDILLEINDKAVESTEWVEAIVKLPLRGWRFAVERQGRQIVFERRGGFFRQFLR